MKKFCPLILSFILLLSLPFSGSVYAADFTLDWIGALDTEGQRYSQWWYTGTNPVLRGTSTPGTELEVTLNRETFIVITDEEGQWRFESDLLVEGEHSISLSTETDSYSFILHLGEDVQVVTTTTTTTTDVDTEEATPVPETGTGQVIAIFGGITSLALGWYLLSTRKDASFLD